VEDLSDHLQRCVPACDPSGINALDRRVVDYHNRGARVASDVLVVALPAQAILLSLIDLKEWGLSEVASDVLLITQAMAVSGAIGEIVKRSVSRPRPYMHRDDPDDPLRQHNAHDFRSFYSSHTSTVFSATIAMAAIFSRRHPGSPLKWLFWGVAVAGGTTIAALRVAAGKHFFSDVMVGAAAGTTTGLIIPALHRRPKRTLMSKVVVSPKFTGIQGVF